ncbi:MAG: aminotransferase class V-fold PLP-dependent enzyme [Candidatus Dormibacteraeota bacterium]|nr:aminotransferase class V-fold PLP-dependent enzyme [Candidatus Dormibacteraeota bacterium]
MSLDRSRFPVLGRVAYLNAGTCGPVSRRTGEVMREWLERDLAGGRGGGARFEAMFELKDTLRAGLGALVGASAEQMILTTSTTEGCNIVVTALRLGPEDEVVTTDAEHPGLESPLRASGATIRVAHVLGRPAGEALDAIVAEVTPRTRLVALSHVLWLNGQVLPIAEIKRRTGLRLLVDGAQSVGAVPVDATAADFYTISGQKWLCGPDLTGALYVADPDLLAPCMAGYGYSHEGPAADRLGVTFLPPMLMAGLQAAVEEFPPEAHERSAEMAAECRQLLVEAGLDVRSDPGQGPLVSFVPSGEAAETVQRAAAAGVIVRSLPNDWIRVSCGWWTDRSDLDRLLAVLAT